MKLLGSRNILAAVCIGAACLLAFIFFGPVSDASESKIAAASRPAPHLAPGEYDPAKVVPMESVIADFRHNSTAALRKYRGSIVRGTADAVAPPTSSMPIASVSFGGGKVIAYFRQDDWTAIAPGVEVGTAREFLCGDWQSGAAGALSLYRCTVVNSR